MEPNDPLAEDAERPAPRVPHKRSRRRALPPPSLEERLRSVRDALCAARAGDLSARLPIDEAESGLLAEIALAFNSLADKNEALLAELERVAQAVTAGRLGERASLHAAGGAWSAALASLNEALRSVASPTFEVTRTLERIVEGDLSHEVPVSANGEPLQGDFLRLGAAVNEVLGRLRLVSVGVSHVVRTIGFEGRLGARATTDGLSGTWRRMLDDINTTVDRLGVFSAEIIRVTREVGVEGKLGGQADGRGLRGVWREVTESVNSLASHLTLQLRNIAHVTTAVANGDLSQKITVRAEGEVLQLTETINSMVERLRTFGREVTRVAREVGTEGKLGGQAHVPGVGGTWQELIESVNVMASNLTSQVRGIARVLTAVANGDLQQKLVLEARGEIAALADTVNGMADTVRSFAEQVTAVAREVGIEGKLGGQARVPGASGTWKDLTDSVNMLAGNLTSQVRNIALVTTAVANGDLSRTITVEAKGEILELKNTINDTVEKLRTFAAEVTRVAREVGTEGRLGGQAQVPGVSGTWKDLTDHVNVMAKNLTDQVRQIGSVVAAVARGELGEKLVLNAKGEIAALADTINGMTNTLRTFAEQVTTVAREVGSEGKLGGQAKVPGASGTWRDLTDNVNRLAANLTTQVRAISDVAGAVIHGDLTRRITAEAHGEVGALADTVDQMIANLRDTTRANKEQNWLKSNLARFFALMQGQRSLESLTTSIMSELTPVVGASHGAFYLRQPGDEQGAFVLVATYAHIERKHLGNRFTLGEGLVGQCALERKPIVVTGVPDDYVHITSGLGEASPRSICVVPVLFETQVLGVVELASFHELSGVQLHLLEQLMLNVGIAINTIGTTTRTEELLQQLQRSNVEIEKRRQELEEKAQLLEVRNREIADASHSLEVKAEELARVSQYKSQFLAGMSHEIRTPLNSMMVFTQMLTGERGDNLTPQQKEWATSIQKSGRDLLDLIDEVLDVSKIEAGRIEPHLASIPIEAIRGFADRSFRAEAEQRRLGFAIEIGESAPPSLTTDQQLLKQILKNLLGNAFKFTEHGSVKLSIERASAGLSYRSDRLRRAPAVVSFAVSDTGIGIPLEKHELVFDRFQQADASIAKKYGGTGLGLTIAREYARVLGGEVALRSEPGAGSTFTLYVPLAPGDLQAPSVGPAPAARPQPAPERVPEPAQAPLPSTSERPSTAPQARGERSRIAQGRLDGRKIVVVDDDARNLYAVTGFLERNGARMLPVSSAEEALSCLATHPDIAAVLLALGMPGDSGCETARAMRTAPGRAHMPIVALSPNATEAVRQKCIAAGCTDCLAKPVDVGRLLTLLLSHLSPSEHGPQR